MTNSAGKRLVAAPINQTLNSQALSWIHETMTLAYLQQHFKDIVDIPTLIQNSIAGNKPVDVPPFPLGKRFLTIHISPIIDRNEKTMDFTVIGTVILIEDVTEEQRLEQTRDEFFSIASHELRTPLTAIRGNAAMIRDYYAETIKDPRLTMMIDDIHDASIRLIRIVNDFLQVSRLEQGKMDYQTEAFDLKALIEEVFEDIQALAQEKQLFLKFEHQVESIPKVVADRDRTKEVLINLIGNSIKYTQTGGISLRLEAYADYIKTLITDTGRGIPSEFQPLVFQKFQQASEHHLTRDSSRSTGLGLYICKLLVEAMGGFVALERSEFNQGSTFSFTLPVAKPLMKEKKQP